MTSPPRLEGITTEHSFPLPAGQSGGFTRTRTPGPPGYLFRPTSRGVSDALRPGLLFTRNAPRGLCRIAGVRAMRLRITGMPQTACVRSGALTIAAVVDLLHGPVNPKALVLAQSREGEGRFGVGKMRRHDTAEEGQGSHYRGGLSLRGHKQTVTSDTGRHYQ